MTDTPSRLLTSELLAQLGDRLEEIGAPITKHWRPSLGSSEMDALTSEIGLSLSTEARIWWSWHDGVNLDRSPAYSSFGRCWDAFSLSHAVHDAIRMRQIAAASARDQPEFHNQAWPDSWIALCGNVSYTRIASLIVPARRTRRMRDEALATLEASASTMSWSEVERRLGLILNVYGGRSLPSIRQRVARIRDRTVN